MRISQLAAKTAVDAETIRYYERCGLLPMPARQANGYRTYGRADIKKLTFIRHCRVLDMPLRNIKRLIEVGADRDTDCMEITRFVEEHLGCVRAKLKTLRAVEKELLRLKKQCGAGYTMNRCGILKALSSVNGT